MRWQLTVAKIANYFIEESCPYTRKKALNKKRVGWALLFLGVGFVLYVLIFAEDPKSHNPPFFDTKQVTIAKSGEDESPKRASGYFSNWFEGRMSGGRAGIGASPRQRNANQVLLRSDGGEPGGRLPIGYGIQARLVNAIHSMDSTSPVIAEISQDVFSTDGGTLVIPTATRVIGSASFNAQDRRVQMRFNTFVFPSGNQAALQGLGMMADGSAGLIGEYYSEASKRQVGKFIGSFVGGLAEGMKERTAAGISGTPYEIGSLKNGILNGVARSAEDQTKSFSEDMSQAKPYMTLNPGQSFVIYLEKEFGND